MKNTRYYISLCTLFFLALQPLFAAPPTSPYLPNETLDPLCAPGDINCIVELSFLTGELDPLWSLSPLFSVGTGTISNWNTAFSWGDHATQGYLTTSSVNNLALADLSLCSTGQIPSFSGSWSCITPVSSVETDPIFTTSASFGITSGAISNWNTAFSWGDHATQGYLTGSALNNYLTGGILAGYLTGTKIDSLNGLTSSSQVFLTGNSGTGFTIASSGNTHTFNIPSANVFTTGILSSTDWNTFNSKIALTSLSAISPIVYNNTNGQISWSGTTTNVSEGTNLYFTTPRFDTAFSGKTTTNLSEGTNLYFTNARSIASPLTGFVAGSGTVTASDSVLQALQKLQGSNTAQDISIASKVGLTSFSANGPLSYNSGSGLFSISQANTTTNGFLSSTDWNIFNSKQNVINQASTSGSGWLSSGDWNTFNNKLESISISTPNNGLSVSGSTLALGLAGNSSVGSLSSTDWNIFNSKQNTLTFGNISSSTPALSVSNGTGAIVGTNVNFSIINSGSGTTGLLSSTDWNTFNSKIALTSLSAISPIVYNNTNGQISWSGTTTNVSEGTNLYFTTPRFDTAFSGKTTTNLSEGTNLYFTNARSIASPLTGFVAGSGTVTASDSVLQALQKLQGSNTAQDISIASKVGLTSFSANGPLSYNSGSGLFSINTANSTTTGALTASDWNTFNNKLGSISLNSLTGATQTFTTGTSGTGFSIVSTGSIHTFNIPDASTTARGFMTTLAQSFEGVKTFVQAPIFSSLTPGSVTFISAGGLLSQNNSNFFWDSTNSRLGIGTNTPAASLTVNTGNNNIAKGISLIDGTGVDWRMYASTNSSVGGGPGIHIGGAITGAEFWIGGYGAVVSNAFQSPSSSPAATVFVTRGVTGQTGDFFQIRSTRAATSGDIVTVKSSGNFGIGTADPRSTLTVNGSIAGAIRTVIGTGIAIVITATDYTVIETANVAGTSFTLPAASTATGRIYNLINYGATAITVSNFNNLSNTATTTIAGNSSIMIQSDGTTWRQIQ